MAKIVIKIKNTNSYSNLYKQAKKLQFSNRPKSKVLKKEMFIIHGQYPTPYNVK